MSSDPGCSETAGLLYDYLDGALSPTARQGLEVHVRRCGSCRSELGERTRLLHLMRKRRPETMPAGMKTRLLSAARLSSSRQLRHTSFRNIALAGFTMRYNSTDN